MAMSKTPISHPRWKKSSTIMSTKSIFYPRTLFGAVALFLSLSSTGHHVSASTTDVLGNNGKNNSLRHVASSISNELTIIDNPDASDFPTTNTLSNKVKSDGMHTAPFLTRHLMHDISPSTLASPSNSADYEGVSGDSTKKGHGPLSSAFSRLVQDAFSSSTTSLDAIDSDEKNEGGMIKESIGDDHHSTLRKTHVVTKNLDEKKDDDDLKKMMTQDTTNPSISRIAQTTSNSVAIMRDDSSLTPENTDRSLVESSSFPNIALNKSAEQSSDIGGAVADRATDGNTNGLFSANSVTHTEESANNWWKVNLQDQYVVKKIVVWNRTNETCIGNINCSVRLSNAVLEILDGSENVISNYTIGDATNKESFEFDMTVPDASWVKVSLSTGQALSLAEVQVFGYEAAVSSLSSSDNRCMGYNGYGDMHLFSTSTHNFFS